MQRNVIFFPFDNPPWYFNKYALRSGLLFHKGAQFIEPLLQYEYGYFNNAELITEDHEGEESDEYVTMDQHYHSLGLMVLLGFRQTYKNFSFKYYIGFGVHHREYYEKDYSIRIYYTSETYDTPIVDRYTKTELTLHTGFELGYRF